jgi:hypothetical protein
VRYGSSKSDHCTEHVALKIVNLSRFPHETEALVCILIIIIIAINVIVELVF